ncbi:MAG: hypothetical protein ACR2KB_12270 [Chitinophagaceae bacterium]
MIINSTIFKALLLVLIAVTSFSCATRRSVGLEEGWELLSDRKVNFIRDKDEIEVRSRNMFTAIRFKVEDKDIRLNDLVILFQNGDKLSPAIDEVIKAGETSKIIEIARDGRYINKITFRYRSMGSILQGRANLIVMGQRYYPGY